MDITDYQECIRAFASEQYDQCTRRALSLLESEVDLELLQVLLISLQRLGKMELAEEIGRDGLRISRSRPWEQSLVKLSLGQISWPEVVFEAADSHQRCQAYYYTGARSMTMGQTEAAIRAFLACQSTKADCLEFELAQSALRLLAPSDAENPEDGFDVERVRIVHEGVTGELRLLRPKGSAPLIASKPEAHLGGWLNTPGPPGNRQIVQDDSGELQRSSMDLDVLLEKPVALQGARASLRIFVSSTFRDMLSEREALVTKMFPQIRPFCTERGLDLIEVDLRWGIPEERTQDVLPICFAEIESCQYFVALLGSRYGSLPDALTKDILLIYPWLKDYEGRSITELEVVYRLRSTPDATLRSLFYFRSVDKEPTPQSGGEPRESESYLQERLKESIRKSGCPVFEDYTSPEGVAQQILKDLTELIARDYSTNRLQDPVLLERAAHEAVAAAHLRGFVPRQGYTEHLELHVRTSDKPIMVVGNAGSGKSALLANWVRYHLEHNQQDIVVEHYVGATTTSADWAAAIRRLMAEIRRHYQVKPNLAQYYEIPDGESDPGTLLNAFHNHLFLAMDRPQRCLILVLDGLDRFEDLIDQDLWWLPKNFTTNIKVILSARPGPSVTCARDRGWVLESLDVFTGDELAQAIPGYLSQYGKELGRRQIMRIVQSSQACQPLFLRVLLSELRIFGSYENLDECLTEYLEASDLLTLFQKVLRRWQKDYNAPEWSTLVEDALSLLASSRRGLSETEWLDLVCKLNKPLPRAVWAPFFGTLQMHLINSSGRWSFSNEIIRQAVLQSCVQGEEDQRCLHERLAEYFTRATDVDRRLSEMPWHFQQCKDWAKLKQCLSDLDLTAGLLQRGQLSVLLGYWTAVGSATDMAAAYDESLKHAEAIGTKPERLGVYYLKVADVYESVSLFEEAEGLYCRAQRIAIDQLGSDHASTAAIQTRLARLLIRQGKLTEAERVLRAALCVKEKALGPIHPSLLTTLQELGQAYEAQSDWERAIRCYERAFEISRFFGGEIHSNTASCAAHLAVALARKGETDRAEEFCRRILAITEQLPHSDNFNTWKAMDILAEILRQRKEYADAEKLYRRILARRQESLGLDDPSTAMTLSRLGLVRILQGDIAEGTGMCRQALEIFHRTIGSTHPFTIETQKVVAALPNATSVSD